MAKHCVVYNSRAGFLSNLKLLQDLFAARKIDAKFIKCSRRVSALINKEINAGCKVIIAAGGDGTVNIVANHLAGTKLAMGIIPIGTFNHFAKDLHIPMEVDKAIATIASGKTISVDTAKVNNRLFVNLSSLGLYPRVVHTRDRHSLYLGKWLAGALGSLKALSWPMRYRLNIEVDGKNFSRQTSLLTVTNNSYEITRTGFSNRRNIQAGRLSLYIVKAKHPWKLMRLGLRAYFGQTDQEPDFEEYTAKQISIKPRGRRRKLPIALDGEVVRLSTPLNYSIQSKNLRIIVKRR